jgi:hypothetical protein
MLNCVNGAIVRRHVEAIPLIDFVFVLFCHLLRHVDFVVLQCESLKIIELNLNFEIL